MLRTARCPVATRTIFFFYPTPTQNLKNEQKASQESVPGKNPGVGFFLLQGIFPTQGLNPGLLHCQADSLLLSHLESPDQSGERNTML